MAATTSSGCPSFFNPKSSSTSSSAGPRSRKVPAGCGRIDGAAMWVINGLAAAFFASMERCSCIRISTVGDSDEGDALPLIRDDGYDLTDGDAGSMTVDACL